MTAQIPLTGSIGPTGPFAILGFSNPEITGNADHVLTVAEYSSTSLKVTSDGTSTAIRKVVAPLAQGMTFIVENATSEGFAITVGGASGSTVTVPSGATVLVSCPDATNYVAPGGSGAAALIVANLAALAAIPASGLPQGTPAIVNSVGADWTYEPAAALAVDNITVTTATGGGQWWRGPTRIALASLTQSTWIIDPVNGNDEHTGLTLGTALKTFAEVARRWGTNAPNITTSVTIKWNSSAPSSDPVFLAPNLSGAGALLLTNNGLTPTLTTTIATYTAQNRPAGTLARLTLTGVASMAPHVGALVHDTTSGSTFWLDADLGTGSGEITAPMQTSSVNSLFGPTPQAIAATNTVQVFDLATLPVVYMPSLAAGLNASFVGLSVQGLNVTADAVAVSYNAVTFAECSFSAPLTAPTGTTGITYPTLSSCRVPAQDGASPFQGQASVFAGALHGSGHVFYGPRVFLDGDLIVDGNFHPAGSVEILIGAAWFNGGGNYEDGFANLVLSASAYVAGQAFGAYWGPGIAAVSQGACFTVQSGTAVQTILCTGGLTIDGVATGFTFNPTTGTYSAGAIALTPAALDTNVAMQNPRTGSRFAVGI